MSGAINYGFAYSGGGWAKTAAGQIQRAAGANDKVNRLLRPLFGPVVSEPHRGNAPKPTQVGDNISVVLADRVQLVLSPMLNNGEIENAQTKVRVDPTSPKFPLMAINGRDRAKAPFSVQVFTRV